MGLQLPPARLAARQHPRRWPERPPGGPLSAPAAAPAPTPVPSPAARADLHTALSAASCAGVSRAPSRSAPNVVLGQRLPGFSGGRAVWNSGRRACGPRMAVHARHGGGHAAPAPAPARVREGREGPGAATWGRGAGIGACACVRMGAAHEAVPHLERRQLRGEARVRQRQHALRRGGGGEGGAWWALLPLTARA